MDKIRKINSISAKNLQLIEASGDTNLIEFAFASGLFTEAQILSNIEKSFSIPKLNVSHNSKYKVLHYDRLKEYLKNRYLICSDGREEVLAINHYDVKTIRYKASKFTGLKVLVISRKDFFLLLEKSFKTANLKNSTTLLNLVGKQKYTAKNINYVYTVLFLIFTNVFLYNLSSVFFYFASHLIFFLHNVLKLCLLKVSIALGFNKVILNRELHSSLDPKKLPVYSILIPMYKEAGKVSSLIKAMKNLNYPLHLLDIKIIVEEDDVSTIRSLILSDIPENFHIIKTPFSLPRTKPKALNYAVNYVLGELLVVYDADDIPEPDQLLKAVSTFRSISEEYVCLQAKLSFYNKAENLLTRLTNMEYKLWFDFLLPGLSHYSLPIPLGGSSNHFKVDALASLHYWDAYNVTEDADLGIRIYLSQFKTFMLDSQTLEESPINLKAWLYQRSRWIKGFLQTSFVFLKLNKNIRSRLGLLGNSSINIFILFFPLSLMIIPFLVINRYNEQLLRIIWKNNLILTLIYMQTSSIAVMCKERRKKFSSIIPDMICLIVWPMYIILHIIAGYLAIMELCFKPFKWNKTRHNISTIKYD